MQAAPVLPSPQHKREPETCKAQDVWCERSGQCVPYTVAATWLVCGSYMCVTRRKLQTPGTAKEHIIQVLHGESNTSQASPRMTIQCMCQPQEAVLHGESSTDQASPRTPTQRTFQPQEAVQPQRNQTILQADTPAQKANYPYKRSHPTPLEADAHTSHVHKNASGDSVELSPCNTRGHRIFALLGGGRRYNASTGVHMHIYVCLCTWSSDTAMWQR